MERFFHNVFLFSMNDELVHTGFIPMAHYLIAIGCTRRTSFLPVSSIVAHGAGADQNPLDITFVVPCLNEENHIGKTLDTIVAAMMELPYSYEILAVDDGSTDGTAAAVETYMDAHPGLPIRLRRHPQNRGLTRSYVDGAFVGRGTYYRLVCGDDAETKEALVKCLSQLGKADMIIPYHEELAGKSAFRRWLSGFYTRLVNLLSGHKIRYYNGLATHLRYNVMRWGPYSFGFGFQAELITRLLDEGCSYVEVPIAATHRDKSRDSSALNFKNLLSVGHTLLEVLIRRVRKQAIRK
jgi:glycosyltransferase involved in cell wall biosynthesis